MQLSLILTALTALLTVLAICIGIFAIFGYVSIKEGVTVAAEKKVTSAMELKMKAYPDPIEMAELKTRMESAIGTWEQLLNQIVTDPAPTEVAPASNVEETKVAPDYPVPEGTRNASPSAAKPESARPNATGTDADSR